MLCLGALITCRPVSDLMGKHKIVTPRVTDSRRYIFVALTLASNRCAALTCALTGVYSAALPGKKAAGVCRTKRGDYGRAVIETN